MHKILLVFSTQTPAFGGDLALWREYSFIPNLGKIITFATKDPQWPARCRVTRDEYLDQKAYHLMLIDSEDGIPYDDFGTALIEAGFRIISEVTEDYVSSKPQQPPS